MMCIEEVKSRNIFTWKKVKEHFNIKNSNYPMLAILDF